MAGQVGFGGPDRQPFLSRLSALTPAGGSEATTTNPISGLPRKYHQKIEEIDVPENDSLELTLELETDPDAEPAPADGYASGYGE